MLWKVTNTYFKKKYFDVYSVYVSTHRCIIRVAPVEHTDSQQDGAMIWDLGGKTLKHSNIKVSAATNSLWVVGLYNHTFWISFFHCHGPYMQQLWVMHKSELLQISFDPLFKLWIKAGLAFQCKCTKLHKLQCPLLSSALFLRCTFCMCHIGMAAITNTQNHA